MGGSYHPFTTDENGNFTIAKISVGKYTWQVNNPPAGWFSPSLRVEVGLTQTGEYQFSEAVEITVDVETVKLTGVGKYLIADGIEMVIGEQDLIGPINDEEPLDFGSWLTGTTSNPAKRFRLRNRSLTQTFSVVVAFAKGNQGFAILPANSPIVVAARQRVGFTMTFTPPSVGTFLDALTFTGTVTDANGNVVDTQIAGITLSGEGTAPPDEEEDEGDEDESGHDHSEHEEDNY